MDKPLVSVLMTAYNREKFIREAIESVINQSYDNWELIIVDDCSTDNTVAIAYSYAQKDRRLKVYVNEKNLGDYPNRNQAASYATGDLLVYVDSDDTINPDGLAYLLRMMQQYPQVNYATLYYQDDITTETVLSSSEAIRKHFFESSFLIVGPGGTVVRRDFFNEMGKFPIKYGPANDMYYNIKMASNSPVLLLVNKYLKYRIHEGQEQNNKYAYLYNNYVYMRDALHELNLGLTSDQINNFKKKNNRRFVVNLLKYYKLTGDFGSIRRAWQLANFSWGKLFNGIFH